jgi:phosphoribosylanthranilate isomerase
VKKVLIKYCGNRSFQDLSLTAKTKADFLGLIFSKSKRMVDPQEVKSWISEIDLNSKQLVGVFVNEPLQKMIEITQLLSLSVIQCHGNETPQFLARIKEFTNAAVWKAIHHREDALKYMQSFEGIVDGFVIDSFSSSQWGGTGKKFDWESIPRYMEEAKNQNAACFIAGGIHLENIDELLRYEIDGIDISSGIERNEKKDWLTIKQIEERVEKFEKVSRR